MVSERLGPNRLGVSSRRACASAVSLVAEGLVCDFSNTTHTNTADRTITMSPPCTTSAPTQRLLLHPPQDPTQKACVKI
jgi:hypothetical protein